MNNQTPLPSSNLSALMNVFGPPQPSALASDVTDDDTLTPPADATPELRSLRKSQQMALHQIMAGRSYTEAAAAARVDRKTLYNWTKKDSTFQSALTSWRARMEQHATDELTAAVAIAARVFGQAACRDWRAAALLLRQRGLLSAKADLPADKVLAGLDALPPARRAEVENRIRELIATPPGKEPEHMPELRALQERMVAEEAAACETRGTAMPAKKDAEPQA